METNRIYYLIWKSEMYTFDFWMVIEISLILVGQ